VHSISSNSSIDDEIQVFSNKSDYEKQVTNNKDQENDENLGFEIIEAKETVVQQYQYQYQYQNQNQNQNQTQQPPRGWFW
jgi:hypothetical protein